MAQKPDPDALRADAAAELHAMESWRARIDRVIALAEEHRAAPEDCGNYLKLRLLGQTATSKAIGVHVYGAWAEAIMREFPAASPAETSR